MNLGLNWVDLVILVALVFFALEAFESSFLSQTLDFISFLISFFFSFRYYNLPAKFIETQFKVPHGLSLVMGFFTAWFLAELIFFSLVRLILPKIPRIKIWGDQFLAILPAVLRGVIFISLTLVLLATFPIQPVIKKAVLDSRIGSLLLKNAYQWEQPVKNVFGGVSNDTLTFLTIKPKTNEKVDLGFQTDKFSIDTAPELEMINLVNKERTSRGLNALVFDPRLREVAREHSADMFKKGYFSHYSPEGESVADRANKAGIEYLVIGENLAYAPSLELAHRGLMNSEGHRANILSPDFGKIGIGIMDGGVYGEMFTQVFSD